MFSIITILSSLIDSSFKSLESRAKTFTNKSYAVEDQYPDISANVCSNSSVISLYFSCSFISSPSNLSTCQE